MNFNLFWIIASPFTAWIPLLLNMRTFIKDPIKIVLHPVNIGVIGLFFCSIVSSIYNRDGLSFVSSFVLLIYLVLIRWVASELTSFEKIHRFLRELWVFSLIPAILGLIEKGISTQVEMTWLIKLFWNPTYFPTMDNYRIMSTFGNPNVAGDWFGIMSLLSFYFLEHSSFRKKKLIVAGNILFICNLVLTGSKGAMTAYMLSAIVFAILKHSRSTWLFLAFFSGISLMGTLLCFNLFETYNSREVIWSSCIDLVKESPIVGCGLMGIYPRIHEVHGHNLFLSISASLGIVGFLITSYIVFYLITTLVQLNRNRIRMAPILTSLIVFLLAHSMVDFTILTPQIGIFFFGTCAVITRFGAVFLNQNYWKVDTATNRSHSNLKLKSKRIPY